MVGNILSIKDDLATKYGLHFQHGQGRRRFTAAAFAHQTEGLAAFDMKRHPIDRSN